MGFDEYMVRELVQACNAKACPAKTPQSKAAASGGSPSRAQKPAMFAGEPAGGSWTGCPGAGMPIGTRPSGCPLVPSVLAGVGSEGAPPAGELGR